MLHLPPQVFPATLTKQTRPERTADPTDGGKGEGGKGKGKKGRNALVIYFNLIYKSQMTTLIMINSLFC